VLSHRKRHVNSFGRRLIDREVKFPIASLLHWTQRSCGSISLDVACFLFFVCLFASQRSVLTVSLHPIMINAKRVSMKFDTGYFDLSEPGSSVSIATGYGDRIPVWARFSAPVQTGPGTHPASCTMGTGSSISIHVPFSLWRVTMSSLLLGMVLSVCTCWFHGMVTLPPRLVSYYYYYYYYYYHHYHNHHHYIYAG
jgi:hypothetical protein